MKALAGRIQSAGRIFGSPALTHPVLNTLKTNDK